MLKEIKREKDVITNVDFFNERNTCHSILSCQIRRSLLSENMLCAMHFIRTSAHIIKIWKISFLTGAVLDIPEQKQES